MFDPDGLARKFYDRLKARWEGSRNYERGANAARSMADSVAATAKARMRGSSRSASPWEVALVALLIGLFLPQTTKFGDGLFCLFATVFTGGNTHACNYASQNDFWVQMAWAGLATAIAFILLRLALLISQDPHKSIARITTEPPRPTKALIMGLSPLAGEADLIAAAKTAEDEKGQWEHVVKPGTSGNQWQQNLRRIAHSVRANPDAKLMIYVLPSTQSAAQLDAFRTYACSIFERPLAISQVTVEATGRLLSVEYEDYNAVYDGLLRAVAMAREDDPRIRRDEICIDVTAGVKLFSIAGSMVTVNQDLTISYVTTGPSGGAVKHYDIELTFLDRLRKALGG